MLVLTRKAAETIQIGDNVVIKVIKTGNGAVKIGIDAPSAVRVIRGELLKQAVIDPAKEHEEDVNVALFGGVASEQYPHVA